MKNKVTTEFQAGKVQIFKSPALEKLTNTNPFVSIAFYGLAIIGLILTGLFVIDLNAPLFIGLFVSGILFWTLIEYLLHRFIFHWIVDSRWSKRFHFIIHGAHHSYPSDEDRLLMPPVPGFIIAGSLFGMYYLIFWVIGVPQFTFGFFPGMFFGYLMYSFLHRATHISSPPKLFAHLWHHHQLHHYKYPDKAYGVSTFFWDRVFGTMPPKKMR
ncbi:MAG: sterol desaturase family protein [Crocinitomicaceae bacterium]|nr:sterol desaturase family protein [Flavobacteriales bacterium]NQZ36399.1 sterol desaturase family protein [Crocinitomicaceae bacterium]